MIWLSAVTNLFGHLSILQSFKTHGINLFPPFYCAEFGVNLVMSFQPSMQALVVTYEGANQEMLLPYFNHRFKPHAASVNFWPRQQSGPDVPSCVCRVVCLEGPMSSQPFSRWGGTPAMRVFWPTALIAGMLRLAGRLAGGMADKRLLAAFTQVQRVVFLKISDIRNGSISASVCRA